jgi:CHAD domain-containing protein
VKRFDEHTREAPVANDAAVTPVDSSQLLDKVLRVVERHWKVVVEQASSHDLRYLDTFDWRLYRSGWTLYATRGKGGRKLVLATLEGEILHTVVGVGPPAFARDVPRGRLREVIGAVIEPRRLLALARMAVQEQIVLVLNADEKTVVRLVLQTRLLSKPGRGGVSTRLSDVVRVEPVKGYNKERKTVSALLAKKLLLATASESAFTSAITSAGLTPGMTSAGLTPGGYKSGLTIPLSAQMRGEQAVRTIHQELLQTMLANTHGVRRNLDPEFLHDYRVAIRGTRSLLKQVKGVFPDSDVRHFSNEFKWLGTATGPVRDLDVYLLRMEGFREELPADMREHLKPLDEYLRVHHDEEQRRLVRILGSRRYRSLMEGWSVFLSTPVLLEDGSCPDAARPVSELAADRIWSTYRRVCKRARVIEENTPAQALHALRIECKKLRYLLEFFKTVYPPEEMRPLMQSLKKLQTNLGNFNDCEVQRVTLQRFAHEMYQEGVASADCLLAMGRLMDHLLREQLRERRRFQSCFASFSLPDHRKRYRRLFKRSDKSV